MSLRSGRVGVNPEDVNPINGKIQVEAPDNVYTKTQADNKFETKTHAGNTYLTKTEAEALQPINLAVPVTLLDGSALTVETGLQGISGDVATTAEKVTIQAQRLKDLYSVKAYGSTSGTPIKIHIPIDSPTAQTTVGILWIHRAMYVFSISYSGNLSTDYNGENGTLAYDNSTYDLTLTPSGNGETFVALFVRV